MLQLQKSTDSYILHLQKLIEDASSYSKKVVFNSIELDFCNWKKLPTEIAKLENVLYYIAIDNSNEIRPINICNIIQSFKNEEGQTIKFPKITGSNSDFSSNILYIGKSKGKLKERFRSHLNISPRGTYGLHLEYWKNNEILKNLKLQLFYATVSLSPDDIGTDILEILESGLHYEYKPLLGRSGH